MATDRIVLPASEPVTTPATTLGIGIFPSDVILRTAIQAGIADLRSNPWLLDWVFSALAQDQLTLADYGEKDLAQARKWFLENEIKVIIGSRLPDGAPPKTVITVHIQNSEEAENTLADVNPETQEDVEAKNPAFTGRFSPTSYDALTGELVLPDNIADVISLSLLMAVQDRRGNRHQITEIIDHKTCVLSEGEAAELIDCMLCWNVPAYVAHLEQAQFNETYSIGCHALGEPVHLTYLHMVLTFILLRYRQELLEGRGLERTRIVRSGDISMTELSEVEVYNSRFTTVTGVVRQVWPKLASRVVQLKTIADSVELDLDHDLDAEADSLTGRIE